eukprot:13634159-Heterocapsa_arctica.AAC.1
MLRWRASAAHVAQWLLSGSSCAAPGPDEWGRRACPRTGLTILVVHGRLVDPFSFYGVPSF